MDNSTAVTPQHRSPLSRHINRFTFLSGKSIAWLLLAMVVIESAVVVLRYGLDMGSIALQESITYLHAASFLLGTAYTLQQNEHVRVDIFYRNFSERQKALVNLLGYCLFMLPVCGFIVWSSLDYVAQSWAVHEASPDAGGLPGVYLLKTLIPAFAILLLLQGFAQALDDALALNDKPC